MDFTLQKLLLGQQLAQLQLDQQKTQAERDAGFANSAANAISGLTKSGFDAYDKGEAKKRATNLELAHTAGVADDVPIIGGPVVAPVPDTHPLYGPDVVPAVLPVVAPGADDAAAKKIALDAVTAPSANDSTATATTAGTPDDESKLAASDKASTLSLLGGASPKTPDDTLAALGVTKSGDAVASSSNAIPSPAAPASTPLTDKQRMAASLEKDHTPDEVADLVGRAFPSASSSTAAVAPRDAAKIPEVHFDRTPQQVVADMPLMKDLDPKDPQTELVRRTAIQSITEKRQAFKDNYVKSFITAQDANMKFANDAEQKAVAELSARLISDPAVQQADPHTVGTALQKLAAKINTDNYPPAVVSKALGVADSVLTKRTLDIRHLDIEEQKAQAEIAKAKKGGEHLLPGEILKQVADGHSTIDLLNEIGSKADLLPGGRFESQIAKYKSWSNVDDSNVTAAVAKISRQVSAYIKSVTGQGVQKEEYERLSNSAPNEKDSPRTFIAKLEDFKHEIALRNHNLVKDFASGGYDTGTLQQDAGSDMAAKYKDLP